MTVKQRMAEGSRPTKHQKTGKSPQDKDRDDLQGPSELMQAVICKLLPTGDINVPKQHRSDSDDEPIVPMARKLSDSEITDDMRPPTVDRKKEKKKKKTKLADQKQDRQENKKE